MKMNQPTQSFQPQTHPEQPPMTEQQKQQQKQWQPKVNDQKDTWASGLFDLNNLSSGNKKLDTQGQHHHPTGDTGSDMLYTKPDEMDSLWSGQNQQKSGGGGKFIPNLGGIGQGTQGHGGMCGG